MLGLDEYHEQNVPVCGFSQVLVSSLRTKVCNEVLSQISLSSQSFICAGTMLMVGGVHIKAPAVQVCIAMGSIPGMVLI